MHGSSEFLLKGLLAGNSELARCFSRGRGALVGNGGIAIAGFALVTNPQHENQVVLRFVMVERQVSRFPAGDHELTQSLLRRTAE